MDNARAGDKGDGSRNKKRRTNAWGETKAVVAIHTSLQLHDPTPPLQIGTGNQMLEKLRDIINEYIESYAPGEESIRSSIPVLKQIITDTAKQRDEWDESVDKKNRKTLMKTVATYCKLYSRRGREMTACCRIRKLNRCVCIFVRCSFCGMEHFRWHGL